MKRPCKNCPFRCDVRPYLTGERCLDIREGLESGSSFSCHETVTYSDDLEYVRSPSEQFCVGAILVMENETNRDPGAMANQMVRIGVRLGMIDLDSLEGHADVYEDFESWIEANFREQA